MDIKVKVWEEDIQLPTYGIGKPEKNPMFFENRVYQGSSGVVYPYPVIEKISDTCQNQTYHAVYLENEYVKIMILPELGGRVQMAYDKATGDLEITELGVIPLVTDYTASYNNITVYPLNAYTEAQANAHGVRAGNSSFSLAYLYKLFNQRVAKEYQIWE